MFGTEVHQQWIISPRLLPHPEFVPFRAAEKSLEGFDIGSFRALRAVLRGP